MPDTPKQSGVDRIRSASDEELIKAGLSPRTIAQLQDDGFTKAVDSVPISGGAGSGKQFIPAMYTEMDEQAERTTRGVIEMQDIANTQAMAQAVQPTPSFDIGQAQMMNNGQAAPVESVPVDQTVVENMQPPAPTPPPVVQAMDQDVATNNAESLMKEGMRQVYNNAVGKIDPSKKRKNKEEVDQELANMAVETEALVQAELEKLAPEYGLTYEEARLAYETNTDYEQLAGQKVDNLLESLRSNMHGVFNAKARTSDFESRLAMYEHKINQLAQRKIDPQNYVKNLAGWQKALIAIGAGLSGFAYKGGNNPVLTMLQQNIRNDIDAQHGNIEAEYRALAQKGDLLKLAAKFATTGTVDTAKATAALDAIGQRKAMVMQVMQNPTYAEKLAPVMAQLEAQEAQYATVLRDAITKGGEVPDYVVNAHPSPDALYSKGLLTASQKERYVPGYGLASDKTQKRKFVEAINETQPAIEGARRILALSKQGSRLNPSDRARVSTELTALVGQLRLPFTGPGVLTDTEYERLRKAIGDPNKLFSMPTWERMKLEQVITKLTKDTQIKARNAGLPVKTASSFKSFKPE